MTVKTIGIIGAGKLGLVLAQLALKAGYEVFIAGSGDPKKIALTVDVLAHGATAGTTSDVAHNADIIILALPLGKFRTLTSELFSGKLVIDAMNHWWEVDGPRDDILPASQSSSEAVQAFLPSARVVKALSHMSYHDLHDESRPTGASGRKAIAVASDSEIDMKIASDIINRVGFDPLPIGNLSEGRKLEPGYPAFGADVGIDTLQKLITSPVDQ